MGFVFGGGAEGEGGLADGEAEGLGATGEGGGFVKPAIRNGDAGVSGFCGRTWLRESWDTTRKLYSASASLSLLRKLHRSGPPVGRD